jgi:hypothetical protein
VVVVPLRINDYKLKPKKLWKTDARLWQAKFGKKLLVVGIWIKKQWVLVSEVNNIWHGCSIGKLPKD